MVPQIKLKEYTTTKQDAPKGIFKRPLPEYIVPDNEEPPVILPPAVEEKKVEEVKQSEAFVPPPTSLEERRQTMMKPVQPAQAEPEKEESTTP